jgi:WD40 repeat protein
MTELEGHMGRITACATSYETRFCCTVSEDKTVRVWDIEDKVCAAVLEGHTGLIFSCEMSSWEIYEPLLLTCGADGDFRIWDLRRKEFRDVLVGHYDSCLACAINEDGRYVVSSTLNPQPSTLNPQP